MAVFRSRSSPGEFGRWATKKWACRETRSPRSVQSADEVGYFNASIPAPKLM
jgi:hypothetical protein